MGATISKAKQLSLPSILKEHVEPSAAQSKMQISSTVRLRPRQKPRGKHHPHVASVSIKRRGKPKYKKVTKSIIGKPSNFKHTAHVGIDNMAATAASIDEVLSQQLSDITSQIYAEDTPVAKKHTPLTTAYVLDGRIPTVPGAHSSHFRSSCKTAKNSTKATKNAPPPPLPPHAHISSSVKKRAAAWRAAYASSSPSMTPEMVSFRKRQQRKAEPRHHPNLGLVNFALKPSTS